MKTQTLAIDLLRIDLDTQSRVSICEDAVESYADLIGDEWPFPPLDVFHDGSIYVVADGFHRYLAASRVKRASIPCNIHNGTAFDARIFGMTANDRHGLRMSRADKRACVEWLLDNGGKMTQAEIAEKAGVNKSTVKRIVAERSPAAIKAPPELDSKGSMNPRPTDRGGSHSDCGDATEDVADWSEDDVWEPAPQHDPEEEFKTQRSKTIKTAEALMRAFDDLETLRQGKEHGYAIAKCEELIVIAREWK